MPHTVYGLMGAIRSHRIESPSVAVDLEVGRPNACSLCHLDRPLGWVAAELESGWGIEAPALDEERQRVAESVRGILTGDAGARALWAWAMGWPAAQETAGTGWQVPYLGQLLADPYDPIRYIAYRSLRTQPGWGDFAYDFVAPSDERTAAAAAVRERWQRGGVDRGGLAAAVLGDGQGRLSDRDFAALLARRDDTPVQLME